MKDDLISRREALDTVEYITSSMSVCINEDECHGMKRMQRQAILELTNMPSAQPEIIRCKDCKYFARCVQDIIDHFYRYYAERRDE